MSELFEVPVFCDLVFLVVWYPDGIAGMGMGQGERSTEGTESCSHKYSVLTKQI